MDRHKAALGVIVSSVLPPGIEGSGQIGDVVVCDCSLAMHLAGGLRKLVITSAQYESANLARQDAAGKVYDYIATGGFCSRLEMIVQSAEAELQFVPPRTGLLPAAVG